MMVRGYVYSTLIAILALFIAACSGGSPTSSSSGGQTIESGVLVIMPLSSESIESGSTYSATISLSNSQGIVSSNPVVVSISSTNPGVLSVSPSSCSLYTASNSCSVNLNGESVGAATLSINASGYAESSVNVIITPKLPLFTCVADNSVSPAESCACLYENDGSGLLWYADGNQLGSWGDWCTPSLDPNGSCSSAGSSITSFNSGAGHCGYNDWHLPTMNSTASGLVPAAGGDWGALGIYAESYGAIGQPESFVNWLNSNGFQMQINLYWSSVSIANSAVYGIGMFNDDIIPLANQGSGNQNYILLVRP